MGEYCGIKWDGITIKNDRLWQAVLRRADTTYNETFAIKMISLSDKAKTRGMREFMLINDQLSRACPASKASALVYARHGRRKCRKCRSNFLPLHPVNRHSRLPVSRGRACPASKASALGIPHILCIKKGLRRGLKNGVKHMMI